MSPESTTVPVPAGFLRNPVHLLALGLGTGCARRMPGTVGTLLGVALFFPLRTLPPAYYVAIVAILFLAGIPMCGRTAADLGEHDHRAIVWDEVVGYLAAMIAAPAGGWWIVAGFVLFRLFDIWKPWPIRQLDARVKGGLGIMVDDLAAAIFVIISLQIISHLPTGWLQS